VGVYVVALLRKKQSYLGRWSVQYRNSKKIVLLLSNGEFAFPVKLESKKTGNYSFRSAPQGENILGTNWHENEVEVTKEQMIEDVLNNGRRTRCVSENKTTPSLRGKNSKDVVGVYVRTK